MNNNKTFLHTIIYSLALTLILAFPAIAQTCPKLPTSNKEFIRISKKIADVKTHTDIDVSTFNDISNLHNSKIVMGFTLGKISLGTKFTIRYQKSADKYCAWLESINVHYTLDPLDVYIPDGLSRGTCKHTEVTNHEFEHVKIFKDTYQEYYLKLKKLLFEKNALTKPSDALLVSSTNEAEDIFKDDLKNILDNFQADLQKVLNKRNQAIDTEESYKAIADRCDDWTDIR